MLPLPPLHLMTAIVPPNGKARAGRILTTRKVGRNLKRTMRRIKAAAARKLFGSMVTKSQMGERIKVTRYNKTAAVLISKRDLEKLEDCEKTDAEKRARGGDR